MIATMKACVLAAIFLALASGLASAGEAPFLLDGVYYYDPIYVAVSDRHIQVTGRVAQTREASVVVQDRLMGDLAMFAGKPLRTLTRAEIKPGFLEMNAAAARAKRGANVCRGCASAGTESRAKEYEVTVRNRSNIAFLGDVEIDMGGGAESLRERVWVAPGMAVQVPMRVLADNTGISASGSDVSSLGAARDPRGTISLLLCENDTLVPVLRMRVPR